MSAANSRQNPLYLPATPNIFGACPNNEPPATFIAAGLQHVTANSTYYYSVSPGPWQIDPYDHVQVIHVDHEADNVEMTIQLPAINNLPQKARVYFFAVRESTDGDTLTFTTTDLTPTMDRDIINASGFSKSFTLNGAFQLFVALGIQPRDSNQAHWYVSPFAVSVGSDAVIPTQMYNIDQLADMDAAYSFTWSADPSGDPAVIHSGMPTITWGVPSAGFFSVETAGYYRLSWELATKQDTDPETGLETFVPASNNILWEANIADGTWSKDVAYRFCGVPQPASPKIQFDMAAPVVSGNLIYLSCVGNTALDVITLPGYQSTIGWALSGGIPEFSTTAPGAIGRYHIKVQGIVTLGTASNIENIYLVDNGTGDILAAQSVTTMASATGETFVTSIGVNFDVELDLPASTFSIVVNPSSTYSDTAILNADALNTVIFEHILPTNTSFINPYSFDDFPTQNDHHSIVTYLKSADDGFCYSVGIQFKSLTPRILWPLNDVEDTYAGYNTITFEFLKEDPTPPFNPAPSLLSLASRVAPPSVRALAAPSTTPTPTLSDIEKVVRMVMNQQQQGSFSFGTPSVASSSAPPPSRKRSAPASASQPPPVKKAKQQSTLPVSRGVLAGKQPVEASPAAIARNLSGSRVPARAAPSAKPKEPAPSVISASKK